MRRRLIHQKSLKFPSPSALQMDQIARTCPRNICIEIADWALMGSRSPTNRLNERPWFLRPLSQAGRRKPSGYWLTRFLFLRLLGLVYTVAFLTLINQGIPLIGEKGLLPARLYLD